MLLIVLTLILVIQCTSQVAYADTVGVGSEDDDIKPRGLYTKMSLSINAKMEW